MGRKIKELGAMISSNVGDTGNFGQKDENLEVE